MLNTLEGLDHVVVMTHQLDAAAQQWLDLGFTVSPRGTHSAHMGTGNHTIMFEDDYIELLGILSATDTNVTSRSFLDRRGEGIERAAFRTRDAQAGVEALARKGITAQGPLHFSRPVALPDGGTADAAFSVFNWPPDLCPADLRIFACQHHTRAAVWVPSLVNHPNTTTGIRRLEVITADPAASASRMASLIDGHSRSTPAGEQLETAPGHADILFLSKAAFAESHGVGEAFPLPDEGAAALVLRVASLDDASRCAGARTRPATRHSIVVPAAHATGVTLIFQRD